MKKRLEPAPAARGTELQLAKIVEMTRLPGGFAKLTPTQRSFLVAAILASVIPSDGKVLAIEVQQFYGHLRQRYQFQMLSQSQTLAFLNETLTPDQLLQAAKQLPELLSIEDRISLIGMLWDIALCDHELHPFERALIYGVSDHAGVPRKKVVEEQARASRAHGMGV